MRHTLFIPFLACTLRLACAQHSEDWSQLHQYAKRIGVDSLCTNPDSSCLAQYISRIVYGHTPDKTKYQGVPEQLDTARMQAIIQTFLRGADWRPLLNALESPDPNYRQLRAYYIGCQADSNRATSLTIEQTRQTLNSYRWLNRFTTTKRILVNIPSATLRVINQQGHTLLTSRVVVGKASTPTPLFTAFTPSVVMYPYWNVPRSITVKELLPAIRKNPTRTLKRMNMQVINRKGRVVNPKTINWAGSARRFPYRLRQSTGCDNALGVMKFNVTSPYSIYLHDTNGRAVFGRSRRAISHGCIRVEKPAELANLLLGTNRFNDDFLTECLIKARSKTVSLSEPIPLFILYNVVDINEGGHVQAFPDIYGRWQ